VKVTETSLRWLHESTIGGGRVEERSSLGGGGGGVVWGGGGGGGVWGGGVLVGGGGGCEGGGGVHEGKYVVHILCVCALRPSRAKRVQRIQEGQVTKGIDAGGKAIPQIKDGGGGFIALLTKPEG